MSDDHDGFDWKTVLFYAVASLAVLGVGLSILFLYFEKQNLVNLIAAEPLPRVAIVTSDEASKLAASWIAILTQSGFAPTLVPATRFAVFDGVIAICDLTSPGADLLSQIDEHLAAGKGLAILGSPAGSANPTSPFLGLTTSKGETDNVIQLAAAVSPVLARVTPSYEFGTAHGKAFILQETAEMTVDARWKTSSRAAVAHFTRGDGRVVWFGFNPAALYNPKDRQLGLFMRTAFRWSAGQPVSEGAVGTPPVARALTPDARNDARAKRLSFSVDRLQKEGTFTVRLYNKGKENLQNPTVRFWLPPKTSNVTLSGGFLARRKVTLHPVPEGDSVLITLPSLAPNEDRILKLKAQ